MTTMLRSRLRPRAPRTWFVALFAIASAGACAHGKDMSDKRMDELSEQLAKVQADNDRMAERLGAIEANELRPDEAPAQAAQAATEQRPKLRTVHVDGEGGDGDEVAGDADAEDPSRPVVRAQGRAGTAFDPEAQAAKAAPPAGDPKADYDAAFGLVKDKQYDKAIEAFSSFLGRFPDDGRADNAMYWRAECFYAKGDYAKAAEQLEALVAKAKAGKKTPDALLKLGMSYARLGEKDKARDTFARLRTQFPKSDAAKKAPHE